MSWKQKLKHKPYTALTCLFLLACQVFFSTSCQPGYMKHQAQLEKQIFKEVSDSAERYLYQEAFEKYQKFTQQYPKIFQQASIGFAYQVSLLLIDAGEYKAAKQLLEASIEANKKKISKNKLSPQEQIQYAYSLLNLSKIHLEFSHFELATRYLQNSQDYRKKVLALDTNELDDVLALAIFVGQSRFTEAKKHFARLEKLPDYNPIKMAPFGIEQRYYEMGKFNYEIGKYAEAIQLYEKALRLIERQEKIDQAKISEDPQKIRLFNRLCDTYLEEQKLNQAKDYNQHALALAQKSFGPKHLDYLDALVIHGNILEMEAQINEAEKYVRQGYEGLNEKFGEKNLYTLTASLYLASLWNQQNKTEASHQLYKKGYQTLKEMFPQDHDMKTVSTNNYANILEDSKKGLKEKLYLESLEMKERIFLQHNPNHPELFITYINLANYYIEEENLAQAEKFIKKAKNIELEACPYWHTARTYFNLIQGNLAVKQKDISKAQTYYLLLIKSIQLSLKQKKHTYAIVNEQKFDFLNANYTLAKIYKQQNAIQLLKEALEMSLNWGEPFQDWNISLLVKLGYDLVDAKNYNEALQRLQTADDLCEQKKTTDSECIDIHNEIGNIYYYKSMFAQEKKQREIAYQQSLKLFGPDNIETNTYLLYLASSKLSHFNEPEAQEQLHQAMNFFKKKEHAKNTELATKLYYQANTLLIFKKSKEAILLAKRAEEIFRNALGPTSNEVINSLKLLANCYQGNQQKDLAASTLAEMKQHIKEKQ